MPSSDEKTGLTSAIDTVKNRVDMEAELSGEEDVRLAGPRLACARQVLLAQEASSKTPGTMPKEDSGWEHLPEAQT